MVERSMNGLKLKVASAIFVTVLASNALGRPEGFVHPSNFNDTSSERDLVVAFIKSNVKKTYSEIGLDDAITLRMMEAEELRSFKALRKVADKSLLDQLIRTYCDDIDMCSYGTLLMMYEEQERASREELEW